MRLIIVFYFSLFFFISHFLSAQKTIFFENYTTTQGLPSNYVFQIFQDRQGFMWFATEKGASRYDGKKFMNLSIENGLPKNMIHKIFQDSQNNIWFYVYEGGICRYNGKEMKCFLPNISRKYAWNIRENNEKQVQIYVNEMDSLSYVFKNNTFVQTYLKEIDKSDIYPKIYVDKNQIVQNYGEQKVPILFEKPIFNTNISQDMISNFYALHFNFFLLKINKNEVGVFRQNIKTHFFELLYSFKVKDDFIFRNSICRDKFTESYLVGSNKGVFMISPTQMTQITEKDGLNNNLIQNIFVDYEKNVWISAFGDGVQKIISENINVYNQQDGLTYEDINDVNYSKNKLIIGHKKGLQIIENQIVSSLILEEGNIRVAKQNEKGEMYVGSFENFFILNEKGEIKQKIREGRGTSDIAFFENDIYLSTFGNSVGIFENNKINYIFENFNEKTGTLIERMTKNNAGLWWHTYTNGVSLWTKNKEIINFSTKNGLLSNQVYYVYEQKNTEKNPIIWIGTDKGISILNENKVIKNYKIDNKILVGIKILLIFQNENEDFFVLTDKYLYIKEQENFRKLGDFFFLFDKDLHINKANFDENNQKILLATSKGVCTIDVHKIKYLATSTPKLYLLRVKIDSTEKNIDINEILKLNHLENNIRFEFANLSFLNEKENKILFQLETYKSTQKGFAENMQLNFQNLETGKYTLTVWAVDSNQVLSEKMVINFEILSSFWLKFLYFFIFFICFLGFIFLIMWYYSNKNLLKKTKEVYILQKIQAERQRISQDLHDNIGSQLTYILHTLDEIQHKNNEINEKKSLFSSLKLFTKETIRSLRETIWVMNKENIFASELIIRIKKHTLQYEEATKNKINFQSDIYNDFYLTSQQSLQVFRITQEIFTNIIKHSFATEISIKILIENDFLTLQISDNGLGFDTSINKDGHYGLKNMAQRSKEIDADLHIESQQNIGTNISITLKRVL